MLELFKTSFKQCPDFWILGIIWITLVCIAALIK
jgi:hypothetical protein